MVAERRYFSVGTAGMPSSSAGIAETFGAGAIMQDDVKYRLHGNACTDRAAQDRSNQGTIYKVHAAVITLLLCETKWKRARCSNGNCNKNVHQKILAALQDPMRSASQNSLRRQRSDSLQQTSDEKT